MTDDTPRTHRVGKLIRLELTALIGVDDFGHAEAGERLLYHLAGMTGLQRDGPLVSEHPAAGYIHHGREVDEPALHRDVGRVQRPDLVGAADGHLAQQVRLDLVVWVALVGAGLRA